MKKTFFRKLVVASAIVSMAFAMNAYAAEAEAAITKNFAVPEGIDVPAETFTFKIVQTGYNSDTTQVSSHLISVDGTELSSTDPYFTRTISYDGTERDAAADAADTLLTKQVNLFSGVTFPAAGGYQFTVTENGGTNADIEYSSDYYTVAVLVEDDGTGTGNTNVTSITVENSKKEKVDGTPSTTNDNTSNGEEGDGTDLVPNGFVFTNTDKAIIDHSDDDDPPNPDGQDGNANAAFTVRKLITSTDADDKTKLFSFDVTVTLPSTYTDFEIAQTGNVVFKQNTSATAIDSTTQAVPTSITSGTAFTVQLTDNQTFEILKLPAGSRVTVNETLTSGGFTPSYSASNNGTATSAAGSKNTSLQVSNLLVGKAGAYAVFTNDNTNVSPTGIIIDNLPFILMIFVVAGGFLVYLADKRRRESTEE